MISLKQYYLFALWLPLILPSFLIPIIDDSFSGSWIKVYFLLGGLPYLFFIVYIFIKFRNKTTEFIGKEAWKLPLKFIPFCAAFSFFIMLIIAIKGGADFTQMFAICTIFPALMTIPALIIGYYYVAIAFVLAFILKTINVIKE